jgi:hypothetical protein
VKLVLDSDRGTGIQACPCKSREPEMYKTRFLLLPGMTENKLFKLFTRLSLLNSTSLFRLFFLSPSMVLMFEITQSMLYDSLR